MFKNLFGKKNNKVEERVTIDKSIYNGAIYRGVFIIGDKVIEGAYIRDGLRTFVTEDGVAEISKGVKIKQLEEKAVSEDVEWYIECVQKDYCTPFIHIA